MRSGFTVVELLLGIALFGIITPSIYLAILSINDVNDRASDLSYANLLAEAKLESLRSAGYNSLSTGTVSFSNELPATFTTPKNAEYTVTQPTLGLKRIDITIQYNDKGRTRTLKYASLMSELGVAQ